MFPFGWKNKKWAGYLLYGVILMGGLLYYRFPSDALRNYLLTNASRVEPRLVLSIDRIEPSLFFGLKFPETQLSFKGKPERVLFRAEDLLIRPKVWSLLQGDFRFDFHSLAYKGDLKGYVDFNKNSVTGHFDTVIELKNIHIGDYKYLRDLIGRHVEGTLGGTLTYNGAYNLLMDGTGEVNLRLTDGRMENLNLHPLFNFESIDFKAMEIAMVLKKRTINLIRVELKGDRFNGSFSGTIRLKKGFAKSNLEIKGTIKPSAAFLKSVAGSANIMRFIKQRMKKGSLSVAINGTLGEPKINFI